ncbi:hypothetical protein BGZ81_010271 [Podila clonocystis]|nr:hypothetical protein BGZ81_010271 [Podila clonocystis]
MTNNQGNRTRRHNPAGANEETDGRHLHNEVLAQADYHLTYDNRLKCLNRTNYVRYSTRSIFGTFECLQCRRHKPWTWKSGKICVEIWFSRNPDRYSTRIHSQKCSKCESYAEPQLDTVSYSTKLVDAFNLWKGLRDRRQPNDEIRQTPPHHPHRCHGCLVGVCEQAKSRHWD